MNTKQENQDKTSSLKNVTKSTIWDMQESDVIRLFDAATKDADIKENLHRYIDIIRTAFMLEQLKKVTPSVISQYENNGFMLTEIKKGDPTYGYWAIKKRPIVRPTDLTYENINHISAAKLIEVLNQNFGGGWESLPQSVQDIIESGFDISTTTLPASRLHKPGGMYEKKVADGFEVLEVAKGSWIEAIFAKQKPKMEKLRMQFKSSSTGEDDEDSLPIDDYVSHDEEDEISEPDSFDDEDITEENYRTTFEIATGDDEEGEMAEYGEED